MATSAPPTGTGSSKLDAAKANIAAAATPGPTGLDLYSRFAFAGAVCCSITHGGLTPVDVYVLRLIAASSDANGSVRALRQL
jgi:solute carrier family 25 phosphate transporter 3